MVGLANVSSHTFGLWFLINQIDGSDLDIEDLFNSLSDLDLVCALGNFEDDRIVAFLCLDGLFCYKRTDDDVSSVTHYLIPPLISQQQSW